MADFIVCNICVHGTLDSAIEITQVRSVVRKFHDEKFTVWRCRLCGSLHSKEDVNLANYYQHYPLQQHKLDMWARAAYNIRLKRLLREGVKPEHRILDFGCGKGLFISFLAEKGFVNAVGYDPYIPEYSDTTILEQSYDVVVAQDVIEHANDPQSLLAQLNTYLHPGGILCIGTPCADAIDLSKPDLFIMPLHQPYHRHILSENSLLQLGKDIGLIFKHIYHRWYYDTLFPTVNYRFIQEYMQRAGNVLDVVVEPPRIGMVLASPPLLFYALFGYFFPPRSEMMVLFQRPISGPDGFPL